MQINVTVDNVDLTTPVGTRPEYDSDGDYSGEVPKTLADLVAEKLAARLTKDDQYPRLRELVDRIRTEEIQAAIKPAIEAAIAKPIRKTNSWGESTGQETTLTELVVSEVRNVLEKRDSYDRAAPTFVQKIIRDEVTRALSQELKEAIAAEKTKVVAAVRAQAAELIAESVRKGIGA